MDTRRLQFTRDHIVELVRDPVFFTACPEFAHLTEVAAAALAQYDISVNASCCGGNFSIIKGVVDAVFDMLRVLKSTDQAAISRFRQYLATKKGYIPNPVVVYYRRGRTGQIGKLTV